MSVHRTWVVPASEQGLRNVLGDFLSKSRVSTAVRPDGRLVLAAGASGPAGRAPSRRTPSFLLPKAGTIVLTPLGPGLTRLDVRLEDRLGDRALEARVAARCRRSIEAILDDLREDLAACYGDAASMAR